MQHLVTEKHLKINENDSKMVVSCQKNAIQNLATLENDKWVMFKWQWQVKSLG